MARPRLEGTNYKISTHVANGHRYASTQPLVVDGLTGMTRNVRIHWGTLDENLRFYPGKRFFYASPAERAKFVYPANWDLGELDKLSGARGAGRPAYDQEDSNRFYGDVWLLEQVADKTGLRADLMRVFDMNKELVDDILTLSFYPYLTGNTCNRLARWQRIGKTPSSRELTPPQITHITQSITEENRMELFRHRAARLQKGELCAVDSTSRSSYGNILTDVRWGKNKERLPLEQTIETVVYTLDGHMPVYYRAFPGNIPDSRSIETILTDIRHAGFPSVILVTDRGYESLQNLERYILAGQAMIMCVKVRQKLVLERIDAFGDFGGRPCGMDIDPQSGLYHKQFNLDYAVRGKGAGTATSDRLRLNMYFDAVRRGTELTALDVNIAMQREALQEILDMGASLDDDATIRRNYNYFDIDYNEGDRTIRGFTLNEKKVDAARRTSGFFAIMTHKLDMDPMTALDNYALREEQEKYFRQMKSQLDISRQRTWSEEGKSGRHFITFVSLVLSSYVRHIWKTTALKDAFSSSLEVLDEMRSIRCIEHRGKAKFITPFTGDQVGICNAFGFNIPEGCAPMYMSEKKAEKKRGRPRKTTDVVKLD
ncbi:MAG: transposase [Bacteroidales bacterium]